MPAKPKPRLPAIPDDKLTQRQTQLMEAIRAGPRGRVSQGGPFGVYLHAPDFGDLVQRLGAHSRGTPPPVGGGVRRSVHMVLLGHTCVCDCGVIECQGAVSGEILDIAFVIWSSG